MAVSVSLCGDTSSRTSSIAAGEVEESIRALSSTAATSPEDVLSPLPAYSPPTSPPAYCSPASVTVGFKDSGIRSTVSLEVALSPAKHRKRGGSPTHSHTSRSTRSSGSSRSHSSARSRRAREDGYSWLPSPSGQSPYTGLDRIINAPYTPPLELSLDRSAPVLSMSFIHSLPLSLVDKRRWGFICKKVHF